MRVLADRAALDADVGHLAQALPALVRSLRYGDVRGTDTGALGEVALGLAERVFVGLPGACVGLDTDAALEMRGHVDAVHQAVGLLGEFRAGPAEEPPADSGGDGTRGIRARWSSVLRVLARREAVAGVVRGRCVRLLLDGGELADGEAARLMGLALSRGSEPAEGAAWIEGFVGGGPGGGSGGGMRLVHDERLLGLVDDWLSGVSDDAFIDVLPLAAAHVLGVRARGAADVGGAGAARDAGGRARGGRGWRARLCRADRHRTRGRGRTDRAAAARYGAAQPQPQAATTTAAADPATGARAPAA